MNRKIVEYKIVRWTPFEIEDVYISNVVSKYIKFWYEPIWWLIEDPVNNLMFMQAMVKYENLDSNSI